MGLWLSKTSKEECRVVFLGLDAAGKTTSLYKMHFGEVVATIPTIGFNVKTVEHKGMSFTCWDVRGQETIRALWHHYFTGSQAIIFVVDSQDRDRIDEAREALWSVMTADELKTVPVLVYANKQDMPKAMTAAAVAGAMGMDSLPRDRAWHVQGCTAVTGAGLFEGLDWLTTAVKTARSARGGR